MLRIKGYRFFFFSKEGSEPAHIHIERAEARGKIWLVPEIEEDYLYDFTVRQQKEVRRIVAENVELFKTKWNEYFRK